MTAPLLRDVFDIPERVHTSDFVLQLQAGVAAADRTLADYVVTESLAEAIDQALVLVGRTIEGGSSKGAFVHGSFGSGKSHFMAVLHLLLAGHPQARALTGLQPVVAKRRAVLEANLLAIDYHLLGKESFEGALLGGYLETVARLHPDQSRPVLHQSEGLFDNAATVRADLGDDAFFARLSGGADSGWGKRASAWTAETYDAAASAPVGDAQRERLANVLIDTYFTSYRHAGDWLDIEAGLRAMTEHAASLGYDGVVLFLDELVLWLAQHLSDTQFIQNETSKVAKLVETGMSTMPIPLISFVARQRDLKDFLGGTAPGAEQAAIGQSFAWWEDRFERIELKAADLPQIVHRRLLTPVSDEAKQAVASAIARVHADSASWGYLLTDSQRSSGSDFALTYPFSPALTDTMVALSALMQRERTALKLMGELLAAGRDELTINDVIPVGDLFDVTVLQGDQPLTAEMSQHFRNARLFYETKMRPYLLAKHGLDDGAARTLPRTHAFHTEDRLAKTLLVAAIAPGTPALANLTAAKLAALNYGTVASFIPGQQAQAVLTLVKAWATEFGEVHIGEGTDPIVSLALTGVNHDSLLELVQHEDTDASRRTLIRNLLISELGITAHSGMLADRTRTLVWRGSRREVDIVFGNIRDGSELPDDVLRATRGWKVVIDFPFDSGDHTPREDLNRLGRLKQAGIESTTIAWIPHFLTAARMAEVGKLVQLEFLLAGEQFDQAARQLNPGDREPARIALDNQRRSLREKLLSVLAQAYGAAPPHAENVDAQIHASEVFSTLHPGLVIRPPVAPSLRGALDSAIRQGLDHQYPDHPPFEPSETEVRRADLTTVLDLARQTIEAGGRLEGIERVKANVLARVATPLQCGLARENVYALAHDSFGWISNFTRWTADSGPSGEVRVADLRARLRPFGMASDVEDLLILVWAALEDREWVRGGTRTPAPGIGQLGTDLGLRPARLPSAAEWSAAVSAAQVLFGTSTPPRRSATSATRLAASIRGAVARYREPSARLHEELTQHGDLLGLAGSPRLATAERASALLDALNRESDDTLLLQVLAGAGLPNEPQALAHSMATAETLAAQLRWADWAMLSSARQLHAVEGAPILTALHETARQEELHDRLMPALNAATARVREILLASQRAAAPSAPVPATTITSPPVGAPVPTPAPVPEPAETPSPTHVDEIELDVAEAERQLHDVIASIRQALTANPGKRLKVRWWLE